MSKRDKTKREVRVIFSNTPRYISFFDINQYKGNGKYQLITRKDTYDVDRDTWEKVLNFLTWERKL